MSENPSSSESAVVEPASAPPTDAAQPDSIDAPKKGGKKKMLIVVVAIIVVAALIGSAAYMVVFAGKKLDATMTPDPIPDVPAGGIQALSVEVTYGGDVVTDDVTYMWSISPAELGDFNYLARANVNFEAGDEGGSGTISCAVTYDGKTKTVEADVTVDPPFLEGVNIVPSSTIILPDVEQDFVATAVDSVGNVVSGATFVWTVSGVGVGDYTLSNTTGAMTTFSASVEAVATLTATATAGSETAVGTATVNVTWDVAARTVDYYWYDLFAHELGSWYADRDFNYGDEYAITDDYPYLYIWEGAPPGNVWIYTLMRMDMVGLNMSELNMNENPEFLPYLGTARGGNAELDWYMNYITRDESKAMLSAGADAWYDGWFVAWNGTVTLDRQAAKAVLGISDSGLDDFDTWWTANQGDVEEAWESWLNYEAGNERLAIYAAYEYDLTFVLFEIEAEMIGDEVVLDLNTVSWGIEALMFRWMNEAWMPTEWYMEDMFLTAEIGPTKADVHLNTAVGYAEYAYVATDPEGLPCWCWEALMQDYVESSPEYPISLYDPYLVYDYLNLAPGSGWYDTEMTYDYTPGAWNLSEGETLTLEWPDDEVLFFLHSPGSDGAIEDIGIRDVPDTVNFMANMTCLYAEPMWTDDEDAVSVDYDARQISYEGPFDMYTWSLEQDAHEWLASEWERLDLLPYGIPFVEFCPDVEGDVEPDLLVEDIRSPLTIGESSSFNVTIVNALTMDVIEDYAGTITFESSDPAAALPADYTFVPATDMGTHEFTVVFNTVDSVTHDAMHYVTAYDVDDNTISGTQDEIEVWEPAMIDHFVVTFSGDDVIATEPTTATITAYNQWDEVHTGYEGTAVFDSDDVGATLPGPTPFTDAMDGVQDVEVTYSTPGLHTLNVTDQDVTEATGESSVTVLAAPVADYFVLTGVNDPSSTMEQPETMTVTVYDQYDRPFMAYDGTVSIESNESAGVALPGDQTFSLGDSDITAELTFTVEGYYTIYVNDTSDPSITGELEVWVVGAPPALDHFGVTGIQDMWENNYSSVTVTAYDQYDTVYEDYVGEITFSTDATGAYELPGDYTFLPGEDGVHTFPDSVMFDEPGTFDVEVEDTSDDTKTGVQEDIVIEDLVADYLVIEGPTSAMSTDPFSVTVTVYHQYDEVHVEYLGFVEFSGGGTDAVLPELTEFTALDAGVRSFTDGVTLVEEGLQTVTVSDESDPSISGSLEVDVTPFVTSELAYKVYDMFGEPWGEWWDKRPYGDWDTDRLLTGDPGDVTTLYAVWGKPKGSTDDQGMIYAPYRWNVTGTDLPNLNVHEPTMMPKMGTDVPGAEASMYIYFQYGNQEWWDDYWVPTWGDHPDWSDWEDLLTTFDDGWYAYTVYDIDMNHEAAEEWLGLGSSDDPDDWWVTNEAGYVADWDAWILDQGNVEYDIFCAYEWPYTIMSTTMMRLTGDATDVHMEIAHVSWGYEMLMTRWLNNTGISQHQSYMEDFEMVLDLREDEVDVEMDAVCQWGGFHCTKQNASAPGDNALSAWVWEPVGADYIYGGVDHPSTYDPYDPTMGGGLTYHSWNCGDPNYDTEVGYEYTPWAFELPAYATLIIELPTGDTLPGYYAEPVPEDAMKDVWAGDFSVYDELLYRGEMSMGYCELGGADWDYDIVEKVLTIEGPWDFTNPHPNDPDLLYHGAPWLEFNVDPVAKAASVPPVVSDGVSGVGAVTPEEQLSASASVSTTSEIVSLVATMCAVTLLIAALVVEAGRRREAI